MIPKIINCFKDCLQCEKKYKFKDIKQKSDVDQLLTEVVIERLKKEDNIEKINENHNKLVKKNSNYLIDSDNEYIFI